MTAPHSAQDRAQILETPLRDVAEGRAWLRWLLRNRMAFHLEDDPSDIIDGESGGYLFDAAEAVHVRARVAELYRFQWGARPHSCPIGYILLIDCNHAVPVDEFATFGALAIAAYPIDDADYGSARQIDAENALFDRLRELRPDLFADGSAFDEFALKATTAERIDEALRLVDDDARAAEDEGCASCRDAIETRLLPCDECGAIDGEE